MRSPEMPGKVEVKIRVLPTAKEAIILYSKLAKEALGDAQIFDQMKPVDQGAVIADTSYIIAVLKYKYEGRFLRTSLDAAWEGLNPTHFAMVTQDSPVGRFKVALGESTRFVFATAYRMLEADVETREALAAKRSPAPDVLTGIADLRKFKGDSWQEMDKKARKKPGKKAS
jgi:hypothetical protein